jgi:type VI secretion system protein VasD
MEESAVCGGGRDVYVAGPENNTWRVVLSRDDLDPDKARIIEAGNNR